MESKEAKTDFGKLTEDWRDMHTVILYGAGNILNYSGKLFAKFGIEIIAIVDGKKELQGQKWNGISITSFEKVRNLVPKHKIVVMTGHAAYNEISQILDKNGLREFEDYCRFGQFICEWFWKERQMNCIFHVDMMITSACTLNCKHCNMFIPYYKKRGHFDFEQLKRNLDLLFERIDYVAWLGLIGGEPLLYPEYEKLLLYVIENFRDKYGETIVITNGTIVPSDSLLEIMRKHDVPIEVSEYANIDYKGTMDSLKAKLKEYNIRSFFRDSIEWCDFGFPVKPYHYSPETLEVHLNSCRPDWTGLGNGKLYYCNVSCSAENSGRFELKPTDYILLEDINPEDKSDCHRLVEFSRGTCSFCHVCGGCGKDNTNYVATAEQM